MSIVYNFDGFCLSIDENVKDAKILLLKKYAEKKKVETSAIPTDVQNAIFSDHKFQKIKAYLEEKKMPGLTFAFTKFYVIDNTPWDDIELMIDLIIKHKNSIQTLPLKTVDAYARLQTTKGEKTGREQLYDALLSLDLSSKFKKLYAEFPPVLKAAYADVAASSDPKDKELIKKLNSASSKLDTLEPKAGFRKGKGGQDLIPTTLTGFSATSAVFGRFVSTTIVHGEETWKEWREMSSRKKMETVLETAEGVIDGWSDGFFEKLMTGRKYEAQEIAGVLGADKGFIVLSVRTFPVSKAICKSDATSYCIGSSESYFWQYSGGKIQLYLYNYNLPSSDIYSIMGVTVDKNHKITDIFDRQNHAININTSDLFEFLKSQNFPSSVIDEVKANIDDEIAIRIVIEELLKSSKTAKDMLDSLLSVTNRVAQGKIDEKTWTRIAPAVSSILIDGEKITKEGMYEMFTNPSKRGGIFNLAQINIFKIIFPKNPKEVIDTILKVTIEKLNDIADIMEDTREFIDSGTLDKENMAWFNKLKAVYDNKDETLKLIKELD